MSKLRKLAMKITGSSTETTNQHHCEFGSSSDHCGAAATRSVWVETTATDGAGVSVVTYDVCDLHYVELQLSSADEIKEERPLEASASLSRRDADRIQAEYREGTTDLPSPDEVREQYKEAIEDTLRRFNQKVEEEGKSPEKAMKEIRIEDGRMAPQESTTEETSFGRVTQNYDGTIDEIAGDCQFHLEDLGGAYYLGVYPEDGEELRFRFAVEDGEPVVVPYSEYYED